MRNKNNNRGGVKYFSFFILIFTLTTGLSADFSRDANGIVSDSRTGLEWQDNSSAVKQAIWTDALAYCEALTLGTHNDWRLPNVSELDGIADRTTFNPAMNATFTNVISNGYWSSTTYASNASNAWVMGFNYGNDVNDAKTNSFYVRCVRDGQ